jgi:molecular chaperone DnaJ
MPGFKNYYQVLGVEPFADADTVRSAFRKLARQCHPDLNQGDRHSEEQFKEINEAYEILGNSEKRAMHDTTLKALQKSGSAKKQTQASSSTKDKPQQKPTKADPKAEQETNRPETQSTASPSDDVKGENPKHASKQAKSSTGGLFDGFLKKGNAENGSKETRAETSPNEEGTFRKQKGTDDKTAKSEAPRRGEDVVVKTAISPQEATDGVVKTVNVQHNELCKRCAGTGKLSGSACQVCGGDKILVRLKKIDVRIPAGVKTGSRVRVAKEGGRGFGGSENGDLFLQIEIIYDASLRIEGMDVYGEVALSFTDAVLGGEVDVPTLNGPVKMTIPPATQTGKVFRLKDRGVQSGLSKGDYFATVVIVTPESLTSREKELYQELSRLRPEKPTLKKPAK